MSTRDWTSFEQSMISKMLMQAPANMVRSSNSKDGDMSSSNSKVYVEHNYVDHYNDPIFRQHDGSSKRRGPRGGVLVPFPEKLYQMLNQISEDGLDDVVSWQPHGRCFVVHQPERFVKEVMPRYFSQTKLTSFQRQVNLYGFRRLTTGTDRNGYYHELFLRGRPDLLKRMTRVRVKGIGCKLAPSPATEPNLYRFPTCQQNKMANMMSASSSETSKASNFGISCSGRPSSGSADSYLATKLEQTSMNAFLSGENSTQSLYEKVSGARNNRTGVFPSAPKSFDCSRSSQLPPLQIPSQAQDDVDLTPLPTSNSSTGYLMDMQDDIINLLSSHGGVDSSSELEPLAAPSGGNILTDLANFWEI